MTHPSLQNQTTTVSDLIKLRLLVGYLGEKKQFGWWDTGFLDATGRRFLESTFPRTAVAAALRSTTEAACSVHDSRIGRVGVFHLFRLPADREPGVDHAISSAPLSDWATLISDRDRALQALGQLVTTGVKSPAGPVQVGISKKMVSLEAIAEMAAHYHSAFLQGIQAFPYFGS